MPKEFTITRSETHCVTYNVSYRVEAETLREAVAEAEKYWSDSSSTAQAVSFNRLNGGGYVDGETTYAEDDEGTVYDEDDFADLEESE